jgi:tRNA threonylcarbamoyladenosine biosynthesis protein TsaB
MLILALDTSTRTGSVALARDGALLHAADGGAERLHVERLPGVLTDLLAAHGAALDDVDRLAVLSGPGGFTGLRVGLATIQGLAFALDRPVCVVSTLEVLAVAAHQAVPDAPIVGAWMRGMRGEVFSALYRPSVVVGPTGLEVLLPPAVGTPADVAALWPAHAGRGAIAVAGDAWPQEAEALTGVIGADRLRPVEAPPLAGVLALLAGDPRAEVVGPHAVAPTYVRRPDAVLLRERAGLEVPETP